MTMEEQTTKQPELVLFVGTPGAGKTTYYNKNYKDTHVHISADEQGRARHRDIFDQAILDKKDIVIDKMNHIREHRKYWIDAARRNGYKVKIIEFKVDKDLAERRILDRKDHPTIGPKDNVRQILNLFQRAYQGVLAEEYDEYREIHQPFYAPIRDLTHLKGIIAAIGDPHGTYEEILEALKKIKPDHVVIVGDAVDRGPVIEELIRRLMEDPNWYMVEGNHENKFKRWLKGNKVAMSGGLEATAKQFEHYTEEQKEKVYNWIASLPLIIKLPKNYVAVHAGLNPTRPLERQPYDTCLYIRNHGGRQHDDKNYPMWYEHELCADLKPYKILFGHSIHEICNVAPNIYALDKGAVYGTGLRIMVIDTEGEDRVMEFPTPAYYQSKTEPERNKFYKHEELVKQGYLGKSELDDLVLYNYTDMCTFARHWIPETINSRGTIYNSKTGEVVAQAFPKFFNLNEDESTRMDKLPFYSEAFIAFEKMDGSLGTLFRHNGKYRVATRGSFYSDQAVKATEMLDKYDLSRVPHNVTLIFEIIYPENKIVVDYGDKEELVLLAAYNFKTGEELPWADVANLASWCGFSLPKVYDYTIEQLLHLKETVKWDETEGWVLRFKNGLRVKVKGDDYMRIAKIKAYMTPLAFWEAMVAGRAEEYMVSIPEELRAEAEEVYNTLTTQVSSLKEKIEKEVEELDLRNFQIHKNSYSMLHEQHNFQKQMALEIQKRPAWMRGYLFQIMAEKESDKTLLKLIRPTENVYADLKEFM